MEVPIEPQVIDVVVDKVRRMHVLGWAYLHHGCPATGLNDYWGTRNWWACKDPDRVLDEDARFDAYCVDCGVRWLSLTDP